MANRDLEAAVLAKMMTSRTACDYAIGRLSASNFSTESYGGYFKAIESVMETAPDGAPPDEGLVSQTYAAKTIDQMGIEAEVRLSMQNPRIPIHDAYFEVYVDQMIVGATTEKVSRVGLELMRLSNEKAPLSTIRRFAEASFDNLERNLDAIEGWSEPETMVTIITRDLPPITNLLGDGTLVAGGFHLLTGAPGLGKSWLMAQLQTSIALGLPFLGVPVTRGKMGWISAEVPLRVYQDRMKVCWKWAVENWPGDPKDIPDLAKGNPFLNQDLLGGSIDLRNAVDVRHLRKFIEEWDLDLLALDPMSRMHTWDENDASEMAAFTQLIDKLRAQTGCAILLVHHETKMTSGMADMYAARGSSRLVSDPTTVLRLKKDPVTESLMLVCGKQNFGSPFEDVHLAYAKGEPYVPVESPDEKKRAVQSDIENVLEGVVIQASQPLTIHSIMGLTNARYGSRSKYQRCLDRIPSIECVKLGGKLVYRAIDDGGLPT